MVKDFRVHNNSIFHNLDPVKSAESYSQSELSVKREDSGLERIRSELAVLDDQEQGIQSQLLDIDLYEKQLVLGEVHLGLAIQTSSPGLSDISNPSLGCHEELVTCQETNDVGRICADVETPVQPAHIDTRPGKLEHFRFFCVIPSKLNLFR